MKFADIPGHEDIKERLRAMVDDDRIPHALLLEGIPGVGKFALARATAAYIHCTNRVNGDSCGVCEACRQHAALNHFDTILSFPVVKKDGKKAAVSDEYAADFREHIAKYPFMDFSRWLLALGNINAQPQIYVDEAAALISRLNVTARRSHFKVVLMWLPERLHEAAANKLLKLVEEPYADTLFIFTSDTPKSILPTIYSRTQRITVRRYTDDEVAAYLRSQGVEASDAASRAALAEGSISRAVALAGDGREHAKMFDLYVSLMRLAWKKQVRDLREWSQKIADLGREKAMRFYSYCSRMTRDNFILNLSTPGLVALNDDELAFSSRFSQYITERNVEGIVAEFDAACSDTALNGNARMIAFDLAIKMIKLLRK